MSYELSLLSPAKINLLLRIGGRRPDGYHEVVTLLQAIDVCDEISVGLGGEGVRLEVDGPDLGPLEQNLAYRAAAAYRAATGLRPGVRIRLVKRVPAGKGLGGGSSDAAGVLRCLVAMLEDPNRERLLHIAAGLGADVPFFLGGSAFALGEERGDAIQPLPALPARDLVLCLPPDHVATQEAYAALAAARERAGDSVAAPGPPPLASLHEWGSVEGMVHNDFEPVVRRSLPRVDASLMALRAAGSTSAVMTGTGSAVFGLFHGREQAVEVSRRLTLELGWPCVVARTLQALPQPEPIETRRSRARTRPLRGG